MKALSLTQPWASAIALGIKHWETRSWPTSYRGEVCIHASKKFPAWAKEFAEDMGLNLGSLPIGCIVCVCDLTECRQTATLAPSLSEVETKWGDFAPERYAFRLENVRVLREPVPASGALGFWNVGWDEAVAVIREVKRTRELLHV
jgi:activating signal cointegrator 1